METESNELSEKIIIVLGIIYGITLAFKQIILLEISPSFLPNAVGFVLIFILTVAIILFFAQNIPETRYTSESARIKEKKPMTLQDKLKMAGVAIVGLMIIFNQLQISDINGMMGGMSPGSPMSVSPVKFINSFSSGGSSTVQVGKFQYGSKLTLKPMPLSSGEQPAVQGYKTKVKQIITISELSLVPPTGDVGKDLINNIIPRGTPWYSQEAGGVTFDDAVFSQKKWASFRVIELTPEENQRWSGIVNSFTCDYCCGSPQNPTIITRCGCAHSAAAQGMAKWFIKNYGDKFSDDEIYGEMARWYALWYPAGTIKRILLEM